MSDQPQKTIDVWADTKGVAPCRGPHCGKRILWAEVAVSGRRMCFEGDAVALRTRDHNGRQIESYDFADNHWAHCPDAKNFGAKRKDGSR